MDDIHKHASKHDNSLKQHLVVIPSATKVYMTEKIPYVFRQNTDFLYLSGCLEPDSALVLTGMRGDDHVSTLFVRERDIHSELWDGPRTGVEGAPALFGVDQAYALTELDAFVASFMRTHRSFILWYDFMNPHQPDVHRTLRDFLGDTWNKVRAFCSLSYFITLTHLLSETITKQQLGCDIICKALFIYKISLHWQVKSSGVLINYKKVLYLSTHLTCLWCISTQSCMTDIWNLTL